MIFSFTQLFVSDEDGYFCFLLSIHYSDNKE